MGEYEGRLQGIGFSKRVPRVHHRVVPQADVDAGRQEFLDPRVPAADGVMVEAALEHGVVERIGDHVQSGAADVDDQAAGIGIVVGVHGRGVAGRHPTLHVQPDRLGGEHLEETRVLIVRLVAVNINLPVELLCQPDRKLD